MVFVQQVNEMKRCLCCVVVWTYIELFEHRVFLYSREHDPHGVGSILQEGNLHSVHVVGQFLDVSLQLCKGWRKESQRQLGGLC